MSIAEQWLAEPVLSWMKPGNADSDVVLSSRIRLARNLSGIPFPNRADGKQLAQVVTQVDDVIPELEKSGHQYAAIRLDSLNPLERFVLVERHITSPGHVEEPCERSIILRDDAAVSILVNEEDHLRIQCMRPGLDLAEAYVNANSIDDMLESQLDFAYSEQLGYLTSCPTNIGTGLRASVMLHLPGLVLTKQIQRMVSAATQLGMAVRGIYGEGTEASGNMFQLSNQLTLGYSEQEIVDNLTSVARQVVEQERGARGALLADAGVSLTDRIWRAYGVLRFARSISAQEALALLSEVRLGVDLGILDAVEAQVFNELLVTIRPHYLIKQYGKPEYDAAERDQLRARVIREKLAQASQTKTEQDGEGL
ncbi:MAG: putative ATP:guanido phosphotransferase [Anaerosporomusa subterranea]|jgi:protein arginine kinase|nr:putative ATP:guanido phosphotransferase [Anaerosporomusa subterranea]